MSFKDYEKAKISESIPTKELLKNLKFNADGLIPAIAQSQETGVVLMMAWMNLESILETLTTKQVCYWSRSRQTYWRKGESSGHRQTLVDMIADCDGDTLLLKVHQEGPACHTNRESCFYLEMGDEFTTINSAPVDHC